MSEKKLTSQVGGACAPPVKPIAAAPLSMRARISTMHSCSFACTSFAFFNKGLMFSGVIIIPSLGSVKKTTEKAAGREAQLEEEKRELDEEASNERTLFWDWEISLIGEMKDERRNLGLYY